MLDRNLPKLSVASFHARVLGISSPLGQIPDLRDFD